MSDLKTPSLDDLELVEVTQADSEMDVYAIRRDAGDLQSTRKNNDNPRYGDSRRIGY